MRPLPPFLHPDSSRSAPSSPGVVVWAFLSALLLAAASCGDGTPSRDREAAPARPWQLDSAAFVATGIEGGDPELFLVPNRFDSAWVRLTERPGLDNSADWLPDGSGIVFHSERDGGPARTLDLYRLAVDPETGRPVGDPVRLTDDPRHDYLPAVSPGGRYVAFLSRRPEPAFPDSSPGQIWLMGTDGSDPRRVTRVPITASLGPAWMPDGGSLLAARRLFERGPTSLSRIWLDLEAPRDSVLGVRESVLVADTFFNYTPHPDPLGRRLAYTAEGNGHARVVVMDVDGTDRRVLIPEGFNYVDGWTPDGRWIVFTRWYPAFQRRDTWLVSTDSIPEERPLLEPAHRSASAVDFRPGG